MEVNTALWQLLALTAATGCTGNRTTSPVDDVPSPGCHYSPTIGGNVCLEVTNGAVCGDQAIDPAEECDGTNLGGATCASATGDPNSVGSLGCNAECTLDKSGCSTPPAPPAAIVCGATPCEPFRGPDSTLDWAPCCPAGTQDACGLDTGILSAQGVGLTPDCQPLHQPGTLDATCPDVVVGKGLSLSERGLTTITEARILVRAPGCCRPEGICGADFDQAWIVNEIGAEYATGLGCLPLGAVEDAGTAQPCSASPRDAGQD